VTAVILKGPIGGWSFLYGFNDKVAGRMARGSSVMGKCSGQNSNPNQRSFSLIARDVEGVSFRAVPCRWTSCLLAGIGITVSSSSCRASRNGGQSLMPPRRSALLACCTSTAEAVRQGTAEPSNCNSLAGEFNKSCYEQQSTLSTRHPKNRA
jgi:hypothetical protein